MAASTLPKVMPHVFASEGGYVDHKADPGGATNLGVTLATLSEWRGERVSKAQVRALTKREATEIYRERYWDAVRGDELPAGIDWTVFDFGINSGPRRAKQHLQAALGVKADGVFGPITMAAVAKVKDPTRVIHAITESRMTFLRGLPTWKTFGKGWTNRVQSVRSLALELAVAPPVIPDVPLPIPEPPEPAGFWLSILRTLLAALGRLFHRS